jgi:hypothetical protein
LVQWADNTLAAGNLPILRTVKPHVVAVIPLADLVDPHTGPGAARTGFGATIPAARARLLACDGGITRIVIGPESQPLDMGRTHRVVPPICGGPPRSAAGTACSPAATPLPTRPC